MNGAPLDPGDRAFMRGFRRTLQAVFQDPYSSLDPRQRIAIARAIVSRPEIVLADEVVSALDLSTRIRIVDLLRDLSQSVTFVLVSHDIGLVALLCPEIVILERGRIVESGATETVLAHPQHDYTRRLLHSTPRLLL